MALAWTAPIEVSAHAIERARERLRWVGDDDALDERIRGELRSAILADRIAPTRPNWTRSPGEAKSARTDAVFIWDEDATHCWVVHARFGVFRVASTLESYDLFRERGERGQRLRPGLDYA